MTKPIRPYLEYQADRAEAVLNTHRAGGRITGGSVGPHVIRFIFDPDFGVGFKGVKKCEIDLTTALRVPELRVIKKGDDIVLEFDNPNPRRVELLPLLDQWRPVPPATAMVGLTDMGQPLLIRMSAIRECHTLIIGEKSAGKSTLLHTMATSLVLEQDKKHCAMFVMDPEGVTFGGMERSEHLVRPPIMSTSEISEVLQSLVHTIRARKAQGEVPSDGNKYVSGRDVPRIFAFIDNVNAVVFTEGYRVVRFISTIVNEGHKVGVHLVIAIDDTLPMMTDDIMDADFPLRIVGRVGSLDVARRVSRHGDTGAEKLKGYGDFLAVTTDECVRFVSATISDGETRDNPKSDLPDGMDIIDVRRS
jgi:DNA segregation ATPase FtsK/SpoIIIE-like protein